VSHYALTKIDKTFASLLLTLVLIVLIKALTLSRWNAGYEECRQAVYLLLPATQA
jgi:hypothetical protein